MASKTYQYTKPGDVINVGAYRVSTNCGGQMVITSSMVNTIYLSRELNITSAVFTGSLYAHTLQAQTNLTCSFNIYNPGSTNRFDMKYEDVDGDVSYLTNCYINTITIKKVILRHATIGSYYQITGNTAHITYNGEYYITSVICDVTVHSDSTISDKCIGSLIYFTVPITVRPSSNNYVIQFTYANSTQSITLTSGTDANGSAGFAYDFYLKNYGNNYIYYGAYPITFKFTPVSVSNTYINDFGLNSSIKQSIIRDFTFEAIYNRGTYKLHITSGTSWTPCTALTYNITCSKEGYIIWNESGLTINKDSTTYSKIFTGITLPGYINNAQIKYLYLAERHYVHNFDVVFSLKGLGNDRPSYGRWENGQGYILRPDILGITKRNNVYSLYVVGVRLNLTTGSSINITATTYINQYSGACLHYQVTSKTDFYHYNIFSNQQYTGLTGTSLTYFKYTFVEIVQTKISHTYDVSTGIIFYVYDIEDNFKNKVLTMRDYAVMLYAVYNIQNLGTGNTTFENLRYKYINEQTLETGTTYMTDARVSVMYQGQQEEQYDFYSDQINSALTIVEKITLFSGSTDIYTGPCIIYLNVDDDFDFHETVYIPITTTEYTNCLASNTSSLKVARTTDSPGVYFDKNLKTNGEITGKIFNNSHTTNGYFLLFQIFRFNVTSHHKGGHCVKEIKSIDFSLREKTAESLLSSDRNSLGGFSFSRLTFNKIYHPELSTFYNKNNWGSTDKT